MSFSSTVTSVPENLSGGHPAVETKYAVIRPAVKEDVHHIHKLIHQMAVFEHLTHLFTATEEILQTTLFSPESPSVLILELSHQNPPQIPDESPEFSVQPVEFSTPINDSESDAFVSSRGRVVVGFVLFFRNFSTFLGKPGFYIEDLFVREAYRRRGLGKLLLQAVARRAARLGLGRVEWCVLDWNVNAIGFYKEMGADVLEEWRICRLTGDALDAYNVA